MKSKAKNMFLEFMVTLPSTVLLFEVKDIMVITADEHLS